MINANELRIGDKVKVTISNDAGIYEILGMPMWGMDGNGDGKEPLILIDRCPKQLVPLSKLKLIPLTPVILVACGFKWLKLQYPGWYKETNNNWSMRIWQNDEHDFIYSINDYNAISIHSVHQLQNIYFALTGKELNFNQ